MDVFLLDDLNNTKEQIKIIKPKNYKQLLKQIKQKLKNISEYYEIFIIDKNNKEFKIDNEENYKKIENILFIREIDENLLEKSMFEINYDKLSESKQEILEQKFNCNICSIIIKKEKPYLCYKCQKIFHEKCLKEWDKQCQLQNKTLICPNCRNELPIENWNKKLDYEENREDNANLINKINEYKMNNNMNNNINIIKDKKINELKNYKIKQNELIRKYEEFTGKALGIFKNLLNQMNSIHSSFKLENSNNKLNDLINKYPLNFENLNLDELSILINEEFNQFKNHIKNNNKINIIENKLNLKNEKNNIKIENENNIINNNEKKDMNNKDNINQINNEIKLEEYKNKINLIYFTKSKGIYTIFGPYFVKTNSDNIELIINNKLNKLIVNAELNEGENVVTLIIKKKLTNLCSMFYNCNSLKDITELKYLDVRYISNFSRVFFGCSSLTNIKSLKNWVVSNGIDFSDMFHRCSSLKDINSLENWDISNGKYFSGMFSECLSLLEVESLLNWNISNANDLSYFFRGCISLINIESLRNWDVSECINFHQMFDNCKSL